MHKYICEVWHYSGQGPDQVLFLANYNNIFCQLIVDKYIVSRMFVYLEKAFDKLFFISGI